MTIRELIKRGMETIQKREYNNPYLEANLILSDVLEVKKVYVMTHLDEDVPAPKVEQYLKRIDLRNQGYPLAYIIKRQEFMGLDFYVTQGVLVPRPDTENIVERLVDLSNSYFRGVNNIRVLDIGSGSGAIGCSLAYYIKNCEVEAFDVSLRAVRVCRINQKKLGLHNYTVSQQDVFQPWEKVRGKYHIVVSNPPYIPRKHIDHLQWEVSIHEPRLALDGGVTGLDYYERIIQTYSEVATEKSVLAFEFGWDQKNKVMALMEKEGQFEEYEQIKDLQGLDRGVIGYRR